MEHWGVDDVTATLEGEYMQWPLFLFTLYRIDLESSVNVMQQDGVAYNRCVRTLILFKFEEVFHPMCRLGPSQVQCTSTDRGTCMCGECQCKRDQAVSSCSWARAHYNYSNESTAGILMLGVKARVNLSVYDMKLLYIYMNTHIHAIACTIAWILFYICMQQWCKKWNDRPLLKGCQKFNKSPSRFVVSQATIKRHV